MPKKNNKNKQSNIDKAFPYDPAYDFGPEIQPELKGKKGKKRKSIWLFPNTNNKDD